MEGDNKWIAITHFINPYKFWYCCTDEKWNICVQNIEEELTKFCNENRRNESIEEIAVGSEIAVRLLSINKYVRGRVEEICKTREKSYIVWAIDRGFPFETKAQYCRFLPEQFNLKNIKNERVHCGGIENVVPIKTEYDFLKQKTVTVYSQKWCSRACSSLEKIIEDAAHIEFVENKNYNDDNDKHYWGDLLVYNHRGKIQRASDYLIKEEVAMRNNDKFMHFHSNKNCLNTPNWQTNDGNSKFYENTTTQQYVTDFFVDNEKILKNSAEFLEAKFKVDAWRDFNKNAIEKRSAAMNSKVFENVDVTELPFKTDKHNFVSKDAQNSVCETFKSLNMNDDESFNEQRSSSKEMPPPSQLPPEPNLTDIGSSVIEAKPTKNFASGSISSYKTTTSYAGNSRAEYLKKLRLQSENARRKREHDTKTAQKQPVTIRKTQTVCMLPAGFDLSNLNKYKKKDHWHCKKTTRNERYPHDPNVSTEIEND